MVLLFQRGPPPRVGPFISKLVIQWMYCAASRLVLDGHRVLLVTVQILNQYNMLQGICYPQFDYYGGP